jgi:tRNA(adenine34) deaminase
MDIIEKPDSFYMAEALKLAVRAAEDDEVPVGCVIVHEGRIIARAHNQVETLHDPTAHAEMIAITQAAEALANHRLAGTTLYVTCEPCAMCAGAMLLARIERVVYGAPEPKTGCAGSVLDILRDGRFNHSCEVVAGVLSDEAAELLRGFFEKKRRKGSSSSVNS